MLGVMTPAPNETVPFGLLDIPSVLVPPDSFAHEVLRTELPYLTIAYLLFFKPLVRRFGRVDKTSGAYRRPMFAYNVCMAVFSLACFACVAAAFEVDGPGGVLESLRQLAGDTKVKHSCATLAVCHACLPAFLPRRDRPTPRPRRAAVTLSSHNAVQVLPNMRVCPSPIFRSRLFVAAGWAFYVSKYVEFADTAWLVLKGKPVSFLQSFHHFGAPWNMWLAMHYEVEGAFLFVGLNAAIHTIM
jgi:hypothetical protein